MDLQQIRYFVAVYEEGSFSRAARRENVSQPSLSVQIAATETRLGVTLFERHARGAAPTVAGERLYARCLAILRQVNATVQEMRELAGTLTGRIRVGLPPSLSRGVVVPLLLDFSSAYPGVDVHLVESYSGTLAAMVAGRELDFSVVTQSPDRPRLHLEHIFHARLVLVSGRARGLAPNRACDLATLGPLKLVMPSAAHSTRALIEDFLRRRQIPVARMLEIDGLSGTLNFLRGSNWLTVMPLIAVIDEGPDSGLVVNAIRGERLGIDYFVSHVPSLPLSTAAQTFLDLLRIKLAEAAAASERRLRQ